MAEIFKFITFPIRLIISTLMIGMLSLILANIIIVGHVIEWFSPNHPITPRVEGSVIFYGEIFNNITEKLNNIVENG